MNGSPCPRCGTPKSTALAGNCPNCLIDLGAPDWTAEPVSPGAPGPLPRLGDYELQEEIARGGMGVVYRARQLSLNRTVAVKVLLAGQFADETFLKRFRREAEAAAGLSHPNIVSIHEVGQHEGRPYFSMELIEGKNLADLVRGSALPARRAAQLLQSIAEAVHFAHERGVLHRDLKPSNVLVDELGAPHITDFGLAKRMVAADVRRLTSSEQVGKPESEKVGSDTGTPPSSHSLTFSPAHLPKESQSLLTSAVTDELTFTGQVLGSPNYMPPEQADPKRGPTTAASDVYSLGAILYHLLTGRPPFLADSVTQTLRLAAEGDPVSPRLLNPALSRDLETICLKCLEKEAPRRYATARGLAEELGRFLRDEPIQARPIGLLGRLARWRRRKPALATSLGAGALLLLIVVVGLPVALVRINNSRTHAESARARAESAEQATEAQLYTALLEQARATVLSGEMGHRIRALDAIRRAAAISNSAELRREVFAALALPDLRFQRELPYGSQFTARALDPAFARIALCRGRGPVEIRSIADGNLLATLPPSTNRAAHYTEWSPDGRFLAVKRDHSAEGDRADWEIWETANAHRVLVLQEGSYGSVSFHPMLARLIAGRGTNGMGVWNLEDGRELAHFPLRAAPLNLRFSPQGDRVAALHRSGADHVVSVYDATNGTSLASHVFTPFVISLAWHPGGRWLAVAESSTAIHWMDAQTGETGILGRHKAEAASVAFIADGAYLFTGGWERELICWDAPAKRRVFTIGLDSDAIQLSADGRRCGVRTRSGIQLHAFERPTAHREFAEDLGGRLRHAVFSQDGRWLAASADRRAGVWDLSGNGPGAFDDQAYGAHLFFTPDGLQLFGSGTQQSEPACFRWRLAPATSASAPPRLERLPLHRPAGFTCLSLNSNLAVMSGSTGSVVLWPEQIEAGSDRWARTSSGINGVSPDGRWLGIYRPFNAALYVYRMPGLERVAKLTHPAAIGDFEFSPLGDEVAICSSRGVELWSTETWQRTRELTNFTRLLYSPDGRALWLAKSQRTAGLYDARTLEPRLLLPAGMLPLAISADGRRVAVSVDAKRLQVWDLEEMRQQLRQLGLDWIME